MQAASLVSTSAATTYHRKTVDGVGVFYREAGPNDAPTIVLLPGFPSSSREFDTLIPLLATRYHLIAPDFPGFGQSECPPLIVDAVYHIQIDHKKSRGMERSQSRRHTSFAPSKARMLPCSRKALPVADSRICVSTRICHSFRDMVWGLRSSATALSGSLSST